MVGLVRFGGVGSLGPIQLLVFDLPVAQRLFDKLGYYDEISVSAPAGVSAQRLVHAITPLLPAGAEVKTSAQQVTATSHHLDDEMAIVRYVLLAFGGIALFVGAFVIFNTLSVTVSQRTRELATLRTLGASRRQLLASVVLEALLIGALASLLGLVAGLGIAKGLESIFASMGMQLPDAGTVFAVRTAVVSVGGGIAVTLLASLAPALRATWVPPIAAVRDGATVTPEGFARRQHALMSAVAAAGAAGLGAGLLADGLATVTRLLLLAAGAALVFVGIAYVSRWLIAPLASLLGRPLQAVSGVAGTLARENSARNPARTAVSAGALTVGLALVAFVATLGAGLRATIDGSTRRQLNTDYVISADKAALPPSLDAALAANSTIRATAIRSGQVRAFGADEIANGVDPRAIRGFYRFTWTPGSGPAAITQLTGTGSIVSTHFAAAHHLTIGSHFTAETQSGAELRLTVVGVQRTPAFGAVLGAITIGAHLFDRSFLQPGDSLVLVHVSGSTPRARAMIAKLLSGFPDAKINSVEQYATSSETSIDTLLNLLYVVLALSVVVSVFGIVNTLALSIVERTREIGGLRAIGMTRRQLTRMITVESEITALIGATIGIVVGVTLAALATVALASWSLTFSVPWTTLLILAISAFVTGRAAGAFPARRAARLRPLDALHYE